MHNPRSKPAAFTGFFSQARSESRVHRSAVDITPLTHLGVLAVRGVDARKFLSGQLSQDVLALRADRVELAGLHNPQGRVLALLRLVAQGPDDVLCVLPRASLADTLALLQKFLLRAKATLSDESALWQIEGLASTPQALPDPVGSALRAPGNNGETVIWRHASDGRLMCLRAATHVVPAESSPTDEGAALAAWQRADIAAGIPEITPATRGEFVAQMLNLDVQGGISFTKGCYTGQEVIARAHYRGRVKRRAQRFRLAAGPLPAPGEKLELEMDVAGTKIRRSAQVINAVADQTGIAGIECLAVAAFAAAEPATAEAATAEAAATADAPTAGSANETPARAASALPMSYSLPD